MNTSTSDIHFASPTVDDGARVAAFVRQAGGLEANTTYAYLLLCAHFSETCILASKSGRLVGVLLGYRKPVDPETLFIWQVATSADMRGLGLASLMLTQLTERVQARGVKQIEMTIGLSNSASQALFRNWATRNKLQLTESVGFEREHFGSEEHEAETLFQIGPIEHA